MSLPNLSHITPVCKPFPLPPQLTSTCDMLPPLLPNPTADTPTLTLSDCSDLSVSRRHNRKSIHQSYRRHRSAMLNLPPGPGPLIPVQSPATSQLNPLSVPPPTLPTPVRQPSVPSVPTVPSLSAISHAKSVAKDKASKKLARSRTRLSVKGVPTGGGSGGSGVAKYRPVTAKKVRSSKSNIPGESRYWTPSEHKLFVEALLMYGPKDLKSISAYVGTRNMIQCRTHEQKCFMRLMREAQRETMQRNGGDGEMGWGNEDKKGKVQKDVYSVPSSCGISLLCVVSEEMTRSLEG